MSWMSMLVKTYDNNLEKAGKTIGDKKPLSVISHMTANAQITLTIDDNGNYKDACIVDKNDSTTIIPVTEKSGSRSGTGALPHPLSDTLSYIAGDYCAFAANDKEAKKLEEKYIAYISELEKWASYDNSCMKVRAIYKYLSKHTLISDLIQNNLVNTDENGKLTKDKINGQPYEKVMVRFRVISAEDDGVSDKCWEDTELFKNFSNYYSSCQTGNKDICYITGKKSVSCVNHPKGIVQANYGAKLLSANDNAGFTFRGRFINADEACTVSYEASQKAHSALAWLAKNQSVSIGQKEKRTYICWNPGNKDIINVFDPTCFDDEIIVNTKPDFAKNLYKLFQGYIAKIDDTDEVVMISLDAATTGRLSVTYYNELKASDFLERMEYWGQSCKWYFKTKNIEEKLVTNIKVPHTQRIVEYAFGTETDKHFIELNDKILKEQVQRIYSAMINGDNIPYDFVIALTKKASNPQSYQSYINYQNVLSTACAVASKYHSHINDRKQWNNLEGVNDFMNLDEKNNDRNYLFGRLHAIQDYAEQYAMKIKFAKTGKSDNRPTNAFRYRSSFIAHPMRTYSYIEEKLVPYFKVMGENIRKSFQQRIADIFALMKNEDSNYLNTPLNEMYLLGYYAEMKELNDINFPKKNDDNKQGGNE